VLRLLRERERECKERLAALARRGGGAAACE